MAEKRHPTLFSFLEKWSVPMTALASIIGGAVWLTTLHGLAEQNQADLADLNITKKEIFLRLTHLDNRLARMEGKIDVFNETRKRRRDRN